MSLWEIHPITDFYICPKDHCDPGNLAEWKSLETANIAGG